MRQFTLIWTVRFTNVFSISVFMSQPAVETSIRAVHRFLIICPKAFGWIVDLLYGPKNNLHAFSYNSAESEAIWMKFGKL